MKEKNIFRVKFIEGDKEHPVEALVRNVTPSDFPGLVCFSDFIFKDQTKMIILPEEESASKRFNKTKSIHIPYHNILFIEEVSEDSTDVHNLPFLKELKPTSSKEKSH